MKKLIIIASLFLLGCAREFDDEYDFRNFMRDKHPNAELIKIDLGYWSYQVNDTINGDTYIYIGARSKINVESHCVNCK